MNGLSPHGQDMGVAGAKIIHTTTTTITIITIITKMYNTIKEYEVIKA